MFIEYKQNQDFLLPPSFKEFLGDSHEATILSELINDLDLKDFVKKHSFTGKGRPAYHPIMLLKVLFYGYMNQSFSSRKLAHKLRSDLGFMYIAGNNKPDFRTINKFRKENGYILENIFTQIVLKAKDLGLIKFGNVSLDGTKIYANASNSNNYHLDDLSKGIKNLFDQASEIDELEDEEFGDEDGIGIPEELRTKEGRDKKRKELAEKEKKLKNIEKFVKEEISKKKQLGINQNRINTTDKDARLMKMKRKDWGTGYNPQNLTENQFILATTVPNSAEDTGELIPILKKFNEKYNTFPTKQIADKGYASEENYQFLKENSIDSYVPHQKLHVDIEDYIYDEDKNEYTDNYGNIYSFKQNIKKEKGGTKGKKLKSENIKATLYVTRLKSGRKKYLHINKNWQQLCKNNDIRLYSKEGKEVYRKRSGCVENVFGNIKMNLGFQRFLLRGFEGVQIEWNLISLAHNLKKIIKFQLNY